MKRSVTNILPIILIGFYSTLFFFTDSDWYRNIYGDWIVKLDTILFCLSVSAALFYWNNWSNLAKISLLTVIILNILTHISFEIPLENYYRIYQNILLMFFFVMILSAQENKGLT